MPAPMITALARVGVLFMEADSAIRSGLVRTGPAARFGWAAEPVQPVRLCQSRLLDRNLLVDQGVVRVNPIYGLGEPLVQIVTQQPDRHPAGEKHDLHAEHLDSARRRSS